MSATEWVQPTTTAEIAAVLADCVVCREPSKIDPWYMIRHDPTGQRISGPPEDFYHPYLQRSTPFCRRRWRKRDEAVAALETMRAMVGGPVQPSLFTETTP